MMKHKIIHIFPSAILSASFAFFAACGDNTGTVGNDFISKAQPEQAADDTEGRLDPSLPPADATWYRDACTNEVDTFELYNSPVERDDMISQCILDVENMTDEQQATFKSTWYLGG